MTIGLRPTPLRVAIMRLAYDALVDGAHDWARIADLDPGLAQNARHVRAAIDELTSCGAIREPMRFQRGCEEIAIQAGGIAWMEGAPAVFGLTVEAIGARISARMAVLMALAVSDDYLPQAPLATEAQPHLRALVALGWLEWRGTGHLVKVTQDGRHALEQWEDPYDSELAAGLAALCSASELLHEAVVLPALKVLTAPRFQGAEAEFRNAVVHAARGEGSQALTEACKALESVMKVILSDHGFPSNGSARELIGELKSHDLLGAAHDDDVAVGIEKVLLQLPKVRNKHGGHGAGRTARVVPPHVVAFGLHLAAANIVYLAACG